ncbi:MAG: ribonuclease Y [Armatimonadetes bacterium]|nr:ribonuclease Y [Armatimonadota bacterium]
MTNLIGCIVAGLVLAAVVIGIAFSRFIQPNQNKIKSAKAELASREDELKREIEARRKEVLLEAKEEAFRIRAEIDQENKEKRAEIQQAERRLTQKEETLDRRLENLDRKERTITEKESEAQAHVEEAQSLVMKQRGELERIARLSTEEAKEVLLRQIDREMEREIARIIRRAEDQAKEEADRKARDIITLAIQRCAVDQVAETTVSVVPLPGDDMKGRIIGREGRNIRAFETMTGVDLIIDDTPEAVVISGFDPVRREIARMALANLILDGRIHPGRIEEMVLKAQTEVATKMKEAAERAIFETGVTGLDPEVIKLLGRLRFRTSYGQNVLQHSIEVSHLAGAIAAELQVNVPLAKRAGLLHDIGKAVDFDIEGSHAIIGMDLLKRYREHSDVCHAAGAHHNDIEPRSVEAVLVLACDAISAARPGARRETLETYVKRLQKLETIADSFPGVEKTYAVQAGREIRVMVKPTDIDDDAAIKLAYDTARKIEEEMEYPGQIKVTVIRETRAVDYAK